MTQSLVNVEWHNSERRKGDDPVSRRPRVGVRAMTAGLMGLLVGAAIGTIWSSPAGATHCASETVNGTSGEDYVYSNDDRSSTMNGWASADYMQGYGCRDVMRGGTGPDQMHGAFGADDVYGEDGHENPNQCSTFFTYCGEIIGGGDSDYLEGNNANDRVNDTYGPDSLDFAYGNGDGDTILVNDGDTADQASGGTGTDSCSVDSAGEKDSTCES